MGIFTSQKESEEDTPPSFEFLSKIASSDKPLEELVTIVLDIAVSCSVSIAQGIFCNSGENIVDRSPSKPLCMLLTFTWTRSKRRNAIIF